MSTEKLARFIEGTTYSKLPERAATEAKRAIMDCLGVILAGAEEAGSKIITELVKEQGGAAEAGVITGAYKTTAPQAAWANGTMAHALDYDDVGGFGHPTVALLPAVLALGEKCHLSGKDVLLSYVVGFEVGSRLGPLSRPAYRLGWHNTGTLGTIAAAAASAKALKLNAEQAAMALGIAASMASGLKQNFGTMSKPLHAGNAARNGLTAALLAQKGFTADAAILENPQQGFLKVSNGGADSDYAKLADGLGERFNIVPEGEARGVGFKAFPSCLFTHTNIEAALYLKQEAGIKPEDVADIEVITHDLVPITCIHSRPQKGLEGKFSVHYCIARGLLDGEVGMKHFTDQMVQQPAVQELVRKVHWGPHQEMTGSEVIVKTKSGEVISRKVVHPRGSRENPMTWDDLAYKYKDCAALALPQKEVTRSYGLISKLETVKDISALMDILTFKARAKVAV